MATNVSPFSSKSPAARKFYGVDVTARLFDGDALDLSTPPTVHSNPSGLVFAGVNYLSNNRVVALISGGMPAVKYEVVFGWATVNGESDSEGVPLLVEAT